MSKADIVAETVGLDRRIGETGGCRMGSCWSASRAV